MKKKFRYGFKRNTLIGFFVLVSFLAALSFWFALTTVDPVNILGVALKPAVILVLGMLVGGILAVTAGLVLSILLQQRGMATHIELDGKGLTLPMARLGSVRIPFGEIGGWEVVERAGHKTLVLMHKGAEYRLDARLMESSEDFEAIVSAIQNKIPLTVRLPMPE